jgi:hypothetical protein
MKKLLISLTILAIAATAASVAVADDAAVYSANTIGVIKYQIPAGGLTCIALPLNPMTDSGEWVFGETDVAKQLEPGSEVFFWTGTGWKDYTKDLEDGTWGKAARTRILAPGEAFFVRGYNTAQEIALVGELPVENTIQYAVQGSDNLDVRGVTPYPVSGTFGTTSISSNLPPGSEVFFWTGNGWKDYTKDLEDGSWPKGARNREYAVGEGIFVRPYGNVTTIDNDRPFNWED